jgi:hypothetical protein
MYFSGKAGNVNGPLRKNQERAPVRFQNYDKTILKDRNQLLKRAPGSCILEKIF